ncbi:tetratricopeptide repeat protein [Kitasatospora sp. NBC_01560]|uniref:tetratricopeptide repeat protein n=1 Tax=Kitasatospora sp. NBC_01560 TaxID=2975965 RepID=UPI0038674A83
MSGAALNTSVISELLEGKNGVFRIPPWDRLSAFVTACATFSEAQGFPLEGPSGDLRHWRRAHGELVAKVDEFDSAGRGAGPGDTDGPAPAGPVLPVLAPPPAVPAGFTGRGKELDDLLALLDPSAGTGGPAVETVVVASMLGMGGMGKTTLGLAAAHEALRRGLFTGVLFLDLHGYDDGSLDAGQALDSVLRGLGTETDRIPPDTDQRTALYRAELAVRARAGERVLVLADNASAVGQVQDLVPAEGPHRLVVTSRDDFAAGLGARLVDLDVLAPEQAVELMDTALRLTLRGDERIAADPEGAARVAALCGYLPLALRIATAQLVAERGLKPGRLAGYLEDLGERLDLLEDGGRAVRTVLERSYRRLAPTHAELFRLLAVNPGPDLSTETAAVFTGVGKFKDVRARLIALSRASLIRQDPSTERWHMHDLVRAYAAEQAALHPQHTANAQRRLLAYYTGTADNASAHLKGTSPQGRGRHFAGRPDALAWLDAEHANLVAAVHAAYAVRTVGHDHIAHTLPGFLAPYLRLRHHLESRLEVAKVALEAARDCHSPAGEAILWSNLGNALQDLQRFEEAEQAHRTALGQYQALGDDGEATAWGNLGIALYKLRRFGDAEQAYCTALSQFQALNDRDGEAFTWGNLGIMMRYLWRLGEAEEAHRTALSLFQAIGERHSEPVAWDNLGTTLRLLRRLEEAEEAHRTALRLLQGLDDHAGKAFAWANLGTTLRSLQRREEAEEAHRTALGLFQSLNDHRNEPAAWTDLGTTLRSLGRLDEAEEAYRTALGLFQALDNHRGEAFAWTNLGTTLRLLRRLEEAEQAHRTALGLFQAVDDHAGEAVARSDLGVTLRATGDFERAVEVGERAVALFEELGDQYGLGEALGELATSLRAAGRPAEEVRARREASSAAYRAANAEDEAAKALEDADE